jgi:chemotaxis protein CheD
VAEVFKVGMAESMCAKPPDKLACFGIGSCVCLALYDPGAKVAGLAHSMLPTIAAALVPPGGMGPADQAKYADSAVGFLVASMEKLGASRGRITAKLVGGAAMFSFAGPRTEGAESLGERNLRAARESLAAHGLALQAEESGGSAGRSIEFDPADGSLLVRSALADPRWL